MPIADSEYGITDICVVYRSGDSPQWIGHIRGRWPLTEIRCDPSLIENTQKICEDVGRFYGKRGTVLVRLEQFVSWLFRWMPKEPRKLKLGGLGKIVILDHRLFLDEGESRFGLLQEIEDWLRDYYLLMVLVTQHAPRDRRDANLAGARVVLGVDFRRENLEDEVFSARAAEAAILETRKLSRRSQFRAALLTVTLGLAVASLSSLFQDGARFLVRYLGESLDDRWTCEVFVGKPDNNSQFLPGKGFRWQECCLRISNAAGRRKQGFTVNADLHGLPTRNLPAEGLDRIEPGKSTEIRFYIGLPERIPADLPLDQMAITVEDEHQVTQTCPLPQPLVQWLQQRQLEAKPRPQD